VPKNKTHALAWVLFLFSWRESKPRKEIAPVERFQGSGSAADQSCAVWNTSSGRRSGDSPTGCQKIKPMHQHGFIFLVLMFFPNPLQTFRACCKVKYQPRLLLSLFAIEVKNHAYDRYFCAAPCAFV